MNSTTYTVITFVQTLLCLLIVIKLYTKNRKVEWAQRGMQQTIDRLVQPRLHRRFKVYFTYAAYVRDKGNYEIKEGSWTIEAEDEQLAKIKAKQYGRNNDYKLFSITKTNTKLETVDRFIA